MYFEALKVWLWDLFVSPFKLLLWLLFKVLAVAMFWGLWLVAIFVVAIVVLVEKLVKLYLLLSDVVKMTWATRT